MRGNRKKTHVIATFLTDTSYILNECKKIKVKVNKPKSINSFLEALDAVKQAKKKASNLLFEEIENDTIDKEKFVLEQN